MEYNKRRLVLSVTGIGIMIALVCLCLIPQCAFATPPSLGSGIGGSTVDDSPIDGGLSILVAAGIGYGVKKLYNKNKSK